MALKYKQTFTVKGTFQFPIDMRRYDGCFPFDESDRGKIERAMDTGCDPWEVKLMRYETKNHLPTIDRWRSFCAEVVIESVETTKLPWVVCRPARRKEPNAITVNVEGKKLVIRSPMSDPPAVEVGKASRGGND